MSDVERQREHFNRISEEYIRGRCEENHIAIKHLIWEAGLNGISFDLPNRPLDVLEPMCGVGEGRDLVKRLITERFVYNGFDYSDEMVARFRALDNSANVWQADATTIKLSPDSYDLIVILGGLHHIPGHSADLLKELFKSMRSGGFFVNFEPTHGNAVTRMIRDSIYRRNHIFDAQTERAFPIEQLELEFSQAGFELTRITYPGLLAYVLYYNPYAFPFLNVGRKRAVMSAFGFDRLFLENWFGRKLSFATFSVWRKP